MELKPVEKQVVVVMGASSGIGRETALRFAKRGARVVAAARELKGLQSLVEQIERGGGSAIAVPADTAEFQQVKAVADRAVREYGHLDTWVQAAAVSIYATFEQTTPEEFKRVIDVNLIGAAYGAMAALPHLKDEGRGAFIMISSAEGVHALPLQSAYSASKAGVLRFLEAMRMELGKEGYWISATSIVPASVNTPLFDVARSKMGAKPQGFPPLFQPRVVADAILYAAEHPTPEITCGFPAKAMYWGNRLAPGVLSVMLRETGFTAQRGEELPEGEEMPGNLFEPVPGHDRVEGRFSDQALPFSVIGWLETHPMTRTLLMLWMAGSLLSGIGRMARKQMAGSA